MEHWHVPYDYPRADHAQAWFLKCLEGTIARNAERESNWMFKQRCVAKSIDVRTIGSRSAQRNYRTDWSSRINKKLEITSAFQSIREEEQQGGVEGSHYF